MSECVGRRRRRVHSLRMHTRARTHTSPCLHMGVYMGNVSERVGRQWCPHAPQVHTLSHDVGLRSTFSSPVSPLILASRGSSRAMWGEDSAPLLTSGCLWIDLKLGSFVLISLTNE